MLSKGRALTKNSRCVPVVCKEAAGGRKWGRGGTTTDPAAPDEGACAAGSSYQMVEEESRYVPGIDYPYTQEVYVYV